jgi:LSD1 subclass zinc finger protein
MQTAIATCQHCGAQLEAATGAASVQCPYCKTVNQIARSAPAGASTPFGPRIEVVISSLVRAQAAPRAANKLILVVILLAVGSAVIPAIIGAFSVFSVFSSLPSLPSLPSGAGILSGSAQWEGVHGAILTDLTGDGVPDLLGRLRDVSADSVTIAAFDGTSGAKLWETGSLGTYSDTYQGSLAFAEGLLVFASPTGQLQTFASSDEGKPRWRASLADRAEGFCQETPGQIRVDLADGSASRFLLADGGLAPAPSAAPECARVATDSADGDPSYSISTSGRAEIEGMRARTFLRRDGGPTVVLGVRDKGTSVPMIAVLAGDPARTWKSDLAGTRPLETGPFPPEIGAVTADRAYTVYAFSDSGKPAMLVAFDLAGQRRWEVPLPTTMPVTMVQATDARVFVAQWGTLQAYDAATGAQAFAIGSR